MSREVTITFSLDEEVTPVLFTKKVVRACAAYGALRPGESARAERSLITWRVVKEHNLRVVEQFHKEEL